MFLTLLLMYKWDVCYGNFVNEQDYVAAVADKGHFGLSLPVTETPTNIRDRLVAYFTSTYILSQIG